MASRDVERVQRTLARVGYGSRRAAEDLVREGRVSINGRVAVLGDRVDPREDDLRVDGIPVPANPELSYYAFNKPPGVTTTLRDPHAGRSLVPFLPEGPRVFPVGRLDRDSEGLLLLTNDGDLAYRVQHPSHGVEKEYLAEVEGAIGSSVIGRLMAGVRLEDGVARAVRASLVDRQPSRSSVRVVMVEGRKREVRRMFEGAGHPVRRLVRLRVGPIRLGGLPPGAVRALAAAEVRELYRQTGGRDTRSS